MDDEKFLFKPLAPPKAPSKVAYLSHGAIVFIISVDANEEVPPPPK